MADEEQHPCKKAYTIAKCMMIRALVDAKSKQTDWRTNANCASQNGTVQYFVVADKS